MDKLLDFLREIDAHTIIAMAIIMWYFTKDIKKELGERIDRLDHDVRKMNTRIGRLEGTVYGKDLYTKIDE